MRAIILSLFLICTVNANIWYINRDTPAGNSGDGTSWATAWKRIGVDGNFPGSINWAVIGDGDTIYVSGGEDSTLYLPFFPGQPHYLNPNGTYTFNTQVVITSAWQEGHNGTVYLGINDQTGGTLFQVGGVSGVVNNVKITGMTFIDLRTFGAKIQGLIGIYADNITFDNIHIITAALSPIFGLVGDFITVSNCIIEDPPNEYVNAQDLIGIYGGRGGHIIENNLFIQRNNYTMVKGNAANVTITGTSLTDTDLPAMTPDYHKDVMIWCNGVYMIITSNDATTFYGEDGWREENTGNPVSPPSPGDWYMEGAHRDGIQMGGISGALPEDNLENIIRNNIILDQGTRGTGWNAIIYVYSSACNIRFLIYNNIFINKEEISSAGMSISEILHHNEVSTSLRYFNNTFIMKGDGANDNGYYTTGGVMTIMAMDTLIAKNNIFICDSTLVYFWSLGGTVTIDHKDIDYNIYAADDYNAESFAFNDYVWKGMTNIATWNEWRNNLGMDSHSDTMKADAVIFQNKYDSLATGYRTLTGKGLGVNLAELYPDLVARHPDLAYDILGNARGSSWDIGAVQFFDSPPSGTNLKSKIFLQGPFSTNAMLTTLNQSSLLPNSQPFNSPPWNYSGNENLGSGPNSAMVDWVLVELRSASNPQQVVSRRAAVLNNNGHLLNTDGSEGVVFSSVDPGSYYVAIYHRNHLAIMSATPVFLSSNSALYDFTTGMNKAYGQNPMVQLAEGKFGMCSADGNSDGIVNTADRENVWLIQNGSMGYLEADFNLNSGVTVHDVNQLWNLNNGKMTQVP